MDKGGGGKPQQVAAPTTPTETDPAVQKKKAARMSAARYAQGFKSTIASGGQDQTLGNAGAGSTANGSLTKLG